MVVVSHELPVSLSFMHDHLESSVAFEGLGWDLLRPIAHVQREPVGEELVALEELDSCSAQVAVVVKVLEGEIEKVLLGYEQGLAVRRDDQLDKLVETLIVVTTAWSVLPETSVADDVHHLY